MYVFGLWEEAVASGERAHSTVGQINIAHAGSLAEVLERLAIFMARTSETTKSFILFYSFEKSKSGF